MSYVLTITLTVILILGIMLGYSVDSFVNIVLASWAELSIANSFYYSKAKAENKIKIAKTITNEEAERVEKIQHLL